MRSNEKAPPEQAFTRRGEYGIRTRIKSLRAGRILLHTRFMGGQGAVVVTWIGDSAARWGSVSGLKGSGVARARP